MKDGFVITTKEEASKLERIFSQVSSYFKNGFIDEIEKMSLRVVVVGPVRVGKSSLINALFELDGTAREAKTDPFFPTTPIVQEFRSVDGALVLYDTPGVNEGLEHDEAHVELIREYFSKCDLILFLLPFEFSLGYYEKLFSLVTNCCGEEIYRKGSVFCITHSDVIRIKLKNEFSRMYTLQSYLEEYARRLNDSVFLKTGFKITKEEIGLVSIVNESEQSSLVLRLLDKVKSYGFFILAKSIKRKRLLDNLNIFKKKLFDWLNNNESTILGTILRRTFGM